MTVVTRWPLLLERGGGWGRTALALPAGDWYDVMAARRWRGKVALGELLSGLPVALLERSGPGRATVPRSGPEEAPD